jgi:hypothetical protein
VIASGFVFPIWRSCRLFLHLYNAITAHRRQQIIMPNTLIKAVYFKDDLFLDLEKKFHKEANFPPQEFKMSQGLLTEKTISCISQQRRINGNFSLRDRNDQKSAIIELNEI